MYAGSNPEQELLEARYHELTQAIRELSKQLAIQCAELKAYQRLSPSSEYNVRKAKRRISEAEAKVRKTMANMKERDAALKVIVDRQKRSGNLSGICRVLDEENKSLEAELDELERTYALQSALLYRTNE